LQVQSICGTVKSLSFPWNSQPLLSHSIFISVNSKYHASDTGPQSLKKINCPMHPCMLGLCTWCTWMALTL
jgi:hypothetical protein